MPYSKRFQYLKGFKFLKPYSSMAKDRSSKEKKTYSLLRKEKSINFNQNTSFDQTVENLPNDDSQNLEYNIDKPIFK